MKKTQFIELINNIKKTFVSFFSILMFVCLSVAVYVGFSWMGPAVTNSVDKMVEDTNFHDAEAFFLYGFTDEDIESLNNDVQEAEGVYVTYEVFKLDNTKYGSIIYSLPKKLDKFIEYEGDLPTNNKQIVVDSYFASINNIQIGDVISFEDNYSELYKINNLLNYDFETSDIDSLSNGKQISYLSNRDYVVTGFVKSSRYISYVKQTYGSSVLNSMPNDVYMYVTDDAFNLEAFCDYPSIVVKNHDIKAASFSDELIDELEKYSLIFNNKIDEIANNKNQEIKNKINNTINEANKKINEAESDILDAQKKINNNTKKLDEVKAELDIKKIELENAKNEIANAKNEYDNKASCYNSLNNKYKEIRTFIDNNCETPQETVTYLKISGLFDVIRGFILENGNQTKLDTLNIAIEQLNDYTDESIQNFYSIVDSSINDYNYALAIGKSQINNAEIDIANSEELYNQKYSEYNSLITKLNKAKKELENAKEELDINKDNLQVFIDRTSEIEDETGNVVYRDLNLSFLAVGRIVTMSSSLCATLSSLFVVVGLFVCYTSISRIVNDQANLIGVKKALGLTNREIMLVHLTYTLIATLIGCILGVALGYNVIEYVLTGIMNDNTTCDISLYFSYKEVLFISLLEISLLLLITYIACKNVLKKKAIYLINGEQKNIAKVRFFEKTKLWNKLSLLNKTIINNFFNDKRRVFGTLVGIVGSTALIVTAFTFNNNVLNSFKYHYDNVFFFNHIVRYDDETNAKANIEKLFDSNNIKYTEVYNTRYLVKGPDKRCSASHMLVINDEDSFKELVNIIPYNSEDKEIYKGIWVGNSYANFYDIDSTVPVSFNSLSGLKYNINIDGYFENYITDLFVIIDKETYKENFGGEGSSNCFLIDINGVDKNELLKNLGNIEGFLTLENFYEESKSAFDIFSQVSKIIILIYVVLSIAMAFLVLLNLLTMFINEKKTELIVLMINGFSRKDAKKYIYSDTILLTILGIIIGVLLGTYIGNSTIRGVESINIILLKGFNLKACLLGVIGCVILTFVVSAISLRRIRKFKLSDINKLNF